MTSNVKAKNKKRGFTLIELIVVMAIIAILAALAIPKFGEVRKEAAFKSDIANAKIIANAALTLLVDGKLTLDSSINVDNKTSEGEINIIESYLQNSPKPNLSGYTQYVVTKNGENIVVEMNKGTDTETDTVQLFPVAEEIP